MTDHPGRLWKGRQAGVRPRRGRGEAFSGVLLERGEKWAGLGEEEGNREGSIRTTQNQTQTHNFKTLFLDV